MCGICGVAVSRRGAGLLDARAIERMRDVLIHRGPDDEGLYVDGEIGLGHRRLSIVDVAGGHQPMFSENGAFCIVYNGEVYNHPTIRDELRALGIQYRTRCDTETVLHLYALHRERAPEYLRGMFAFAIWDRERRELFLARDRFGVKPLYYAVTVDGSLCFASEIKALFASGLLQPKLNIRALPDYLANHSPSDSETLFEGVRRLPPGCTLRWRDGDMQIARYWEHRFAPDTDDRATDDELVREFRRRFEEAVRLRLMADVPLGVFLSGGIDSAAIAATMSRLVDAPIRTFSVAFAEREANELEFARLVARRIGAEHHEIIVSPEQFFGALPRLVWHEDEPIAHPSSVALHFVSRLAAGHVKVVLTGEGSDEMLGGYGRYRTTAFNLALGQRYQRFAPSAVRSAVRALIGHLPQRSRFARRLKRTALYLRADLTTLYFDNFAVFSRAEQHQLLRPEVQEQLGDINPYDAQERHLGAVDGASLLNKLLYVDVKTYLHELLMKQDQMSMSASIESRVPFLDHPLVEFVSTLPDRLKLRGLTTKYVLREAMRGVLPDAILTRRKMGFPVPIGRWFRGRWRSVIDEFVLGERALERGLLHPDVVRGLVERHVRGEDHAERLWALVNLELWHRAFLDADPVSGIDETAKAEHVRQPANARARAGVGIA